VAIAEGTIFADGEPLLRVSELGLIGEHNAENAVAAAAAALAMGLPRDAVHEGLRTFAGVPHRLEPVAEIDGVRFVNDSKATNVDAAARSIESFSSVVAIIGGKFKGGDLGDLAGPLRAHGRAVVAIGESRPLVREALAKTVPVIEAVSLADAVREAWRLARPDGTVLLAPACASFDMFVDYADRGRRFKEEVRRFADERRTKGEQ